MADRPKTPVVMLEVAPQNPLTPVERDINVTEPEVGKYLANFKDEAGFSRYLEATKDVVLVSLGQRQLQDQRSLAEQLQTLYILANQSGLYDAADWLQNHLNRMLR